MRLKKFEIKNYRSLTEATIEFGDLTIFIGKNDAGKSNVLKALDLFFNLHGSKDITEIATGSSSRTTFEHTIAITDYRIFPDSKPSKITIVADIELNSDEIKEIFPEEKMTFAPGVTDVLTRQPGHKAYDRKDLNNTLTLSAEVIGRPDKKITWSINSIKLGEIILFSRDPPPKQLIKLKNGMYNFGGSGEPVLSDASLDILLGEKFYFIPAVRSLKKEGKVLDKPSPEGGATPSYYFRLEKDTSISGEETFKTIRKDVSKLFPEYNTITSKEDGRGSIEVYFEKFPSASVGDGIKQTFLTVFKLELFKNKIFGLEEPEIHLHPEKQRDIFTFLKEKSKESQIIITTQSPILVDCSDNVKTYLVTKDRGSNRTKIKHVGGRNEFKEIKLELGARNTDLFFYDCVVLIEGETEERALRIIADAMGYDLDATGIKLINIGGSGKYAKMEEFLKYLKDSGIVIYVIVDKHEDAITKIHDWEREGLLGTESHSIWKGDFEDVFGVERVVDAMREIAEEGKFEFGLAPEDLRRRKEESGKSIAEILQQWLYEEKSLTLNKPELGEKLGSLVAKEIEKGGKRKETEVEKAIRKIIKLVEQNSAPLASSE